MGPQTNPCELRFRLREPTSLLALHALGILTTALRVEARNLHLETIAKAVNERKEDLGGYCRPQSVATDRSDWL